MTDAWFKPKTHGYGAYPVGWKGWAATLAYVVAMSGAALALTLPATLAGGAPSAWSVVAYILLASALPWGFVRLARARTAGEWRWRWGGGR